MATCQMCGKKSRYGVLIGNAKVGKWLCELCDEEVDTNKTNNKNNDKR